MFMVNGKIAVTPFETTSITVEVKGGLPVIKQKQELTKLTVVFGNYNGWGSAPALVFRGGDTIWVKGDCMKHAYAREVFEHEGKSFILLPVDMVVAVKPKGVYEQGE